jgi:hypothetical protein
MRSCGQDAFGSGQGSVAGFCEHDNETSAYIKVWEFLDQVNDW